MLLIVGPERVFLATRQLDRCNVAQKSQNPPCLQLDIVLKELDTKFSTLGLKKKLIM